MVLRKQEGERETCNDLNERLRELEDALDNVDMNLRQDKASMPGVEDDKSSSAGIGGVSYLYIAAALIPIVVAAALYFAKPQMVLRKEKGKSVICMKNLAKWTAIITAAGWAVLFGLKYCGIFNGSASASSNAGDSDE